MVQDTLHEFTVFLLCRSDSGVVNIYDEQYLHQTQPKPLKAVMNLTTSVNKALFNSTRYVSFFNKLFVKLVKNGFLSAGEKLKN